MDSNKILIGFAVVIVALLASPIVAKKMRADNPASTTANAPTAATGASQSAAGAAQASYPELKEPPLLNEANLIGTEWQILFEKPIQHSADRWKPLWAKQ